MVIWFIIMLYAVSQKDSSQLAYQIKTIHIFLITISLLLVWRCILFIYEFHIFQRLDGFIQQQNNAKYKFRGLLWKISTSLRYLILEPNLHIPINSFENRSRKKEPIRRQNTPKFNDDAYKSPKLKKITPKVQLQLSAKSFLTFGDG